MVLLEVKRKRVSSSFQEFGVPRKQDGALEPHVYITTLFYETSNSMTSTASGYATASRDPNAFA